MIEILIAVGILGGLGLAFGLVLAAASKVFYVETDPRLDALNECLPGANCGGCGYAGCGGYAEAVLKGEAPIGKCASGGNECAQAMSAIMGVKAEAVARKVALVKCSGQKTYDEVGNQIGGAKVKGIYEGFKDCLAASKVGGRGPLSCMYGCLGYGNCVKACKYDAIHVIDGVAKVDVDKCVGYVNLFFAKKLSEAGIQCMVFNPALPVLNMFMNHRDHRKITVIDGKVGFTGGYNLSDEYFGRKITYGRWKDTGIRLEGEAVRSLTAAFLEIWNACSRKEEPVEPFITVRHSVSGTQGFVQPYEDNPLGRERTAENVYLNLIYAAKKTLYVVTPYLIITDEMTNALGCAAKRGVDVRIITPGVPDKKIVYAVTRSYYAGLAAQGVRIFEYSPGFCHAKQMLCDGAVASIGTSNLDYRSLYLHFENNVILYGTDAVRQMSADFEELFPQCEEVTEKYRSGRSRALRAGQYILRLFAPMM